MESTSRIASELPNTNAWLMRNLYQSKRPLRLSGRGRRRACGATAAVAVAAAVPPAVAPVAPAAVARTAVATALVRASTARAHGETARDQQDADASAAPAAPPGDRPVVVRFVRRNRR